MKITYLVANYNNAKYLPDCLESLLRQTNPNWLCLIGDDGSSDNSVEMIQLYADKRIQLVKNRKNLGKVRTLKKLIDRTETDIVGVLDSDDALDTQATEWVLQTYAKDSNAGFVYTNSAKYSYDLKKIIRANLSNRIPPGHSSLTKGFITHLITFRVSAYRKTVGLVDDMVNAIDRDLCFKLEEVTKPIFLNKMLYKYRFVPESLSNGKRNKNLANKNYLLARKNAIRRRKLKEFERFDTTFFSYAVYWANKSSLSKKIVWCLLNDFYYPNYRNIQYNVMKLIRTINKISLLMKVAKGSAGVMTNRIRAENRNYSHNQIML